MPFFMCWKNTASSYGLAARIFHWVVGVMIIGLWCVGIWMSDLPKEYPDRFFYYGVHKAMGIIVLTLAAARLLWRLSQVRVQPVAGLTAMQHKLAEAAHMGLYFLMFAMPLSGWAMSSAAGYPVSVFGLFTMPPLVGKDEAMAGFYRETHETLALVLAALVALHVVAALWHHFIRKDNVLKRMLFS